MPKSFGELLRTQRKSLGLRLEDVAQALEVSKQVISNWETDKSLPPQFRLALIAKAYVLENAALLGHYDGTKGSSKAMEAGEGIPYICEMIDEVAGKAKKDKQHRWIFHSLSTSNYLTSSEAQIGEAVFNCAAAGVDIAYIHLPLGELEADFNAVLARSLKQNLGMMIPDVKQQEAAKSHLWAVSPTKRPKSNNMAVFSGSILGIFTRVIALIKATPLDGKDAEDWQKRLFPTFEDVERFWLDIAVPDPKTRLIGPHWIPIDAKGTNLSLNYRKELAKRLKHLNAEKFLMNSN